MLGWISDIAADIKNIFVDTVEQTQTSLIAGVTRPAQAPESQLKEVGLPSIEALVIESGPAPVSPSLADL